MKAFLVAVCEHVIDYVFFMLCDRAKIGKPPW
jgi:hypothetical protein